ncbi:trigger factor [Limoniibacter endophyticus]|nr:trigger factor [Limoniibacter endophyticus]
MQVTETLNSGLKRELKIVVPASDMEARLQERLNDAKDKVQLKGFRPGKVPAGHLRKMYGKSFMAEVVNEILNNSVRDILAERGEKSAMQPEVKMTEDEAEADKVLSGNADFQFELVYEVLPNIELKDVSGIKINRPVYEVPAEEIEEQARKITASAREYETKKGKAALWDKVVLDYLGKIDGEPFDGGAAEDSELILGSGQFIPGFEEELVGFKAGDEKPIKVTFPENYQAAHLAGKEAIFEIKVKDVLAPKSTEIDDETASKLGVESAEKLRELVRTQIEGEFSQITRQKIKRQLLDALDGEYQLETPSKLVESEFNNIWGQVTADLAAADRTFEDEETTEDEARAEYQRLAERRVRLGLVLADIGEKANVQVSEEELQRALFDVVRRYPPAQQQQVFEFYRSNPQAVTSLRAPIFEEKVVDHLLTQVSVTDQKVSKEELLADDEAEAAEKPAKKKAAPKKKVAAEGEEAAEKPAPKKKAAAKKADAE